MVQPQEIRRSPLRPVMEACVSVTRPTRTAHGLLLKGSGVRGFLKDARTWAAAGGGLVSTVIADSRTAAASAGTEDITVFGFGSPWR